ncbi:hypothetical protein AVEN_60500-1 [Araneus ventricosus]|uniref:Uncharacterized protein n=1 Tax=Araneus ventricosus TaxID=182803 RepID=A0A4Y2GAT4_ARAVE|nr:hypothetical protein AVEN_60500-1 [Araneus ventricosus]
MGSDVGFWSGESSGYSEPHDRVLASRSEGRGFKTPFQKRSTVYAGLVNVKNVVSKCPPFDVVWKLGDGDP